MANFILIAFLAAIWRLVLTSVVLVKEVRSGLKWHQSIGRAWGIILV